MAMRSVGFQLVTAGKAQVRNDFAEVKADGVASVKAIGLAAEASATKAGRAVDDLTDRQIASYRRQAAAAKLAAAGAANQDAFNAALATPTSQQFATVNTDRSTGAARRSADVFEAAARDEAEAAARVAEAERVASRAADERAATVAKLRAAIDPLWAAEQRLAAEMADVAVAQQSGVLSTDQLAEAQVRARARFDETRLSLDANASALARWQGMANEAKLAAAAETRQGDFDTALANRGSGSQYATVDLDRSTGAARKSAEAFEEQFRAEEAATAAATKLRAAIDPLWAAEQRLAAELGEVNLAEKAGILTARQLATAQDDARKRFDDTTAAIKRQNGESAALSKNQKQTLIYTLSDIVGSSANGINPQQLLMQQGPQVLQSFAAEEGGLAKIRTLLFGGETIADGFDAIGDAARESGRDVGEGSRDTGGALDGLKDKAKDAASSLAEEHGVAGATKKVTGLLTPARLAMGATAIAAVIAAKAWLDYSNSIEKFNAVAQGSGRVLGLNGSQLEANAASAAKAGDMSVAAAREIELAYVSTGKITSGVLVGLTAMTQDFAAATGTDAKAAAATLGAAFADPINGAEELAVKYGAVSLATADYIAKLVEQGDMVGAQRVLLELLQPAFDGAADHANVLAQGWDNIKNAASGAWEWMGKALDRMATGGAIQDKIRDLEQQRDRGPTVGQMLMGTSRDEYRAGIDKQISALRFEAQQDVARADRAKANSTRAAGQQVVDRYTGADQLGGYQSAAGKLRAALKTDMPPEDRKALTETLSAYTHAIDTFIPRQEKANQLAALDARIAATKSPSAKAALATERARLEMSGQVIDRSSAETMALSRGDRARAQATGSGNKHAESLARQAASMEVSAAAALDVADAYLKSSAAGMVAEARRKASTDATRKGIDVDAQMRRQLNLSISDGVASATKTIAGLRDETAARKAANDNVAAGTLTVEQMNQALSDETALRPLLAAATIAQGQGMTAAYDGIMRAVAAYRGALADAHAEEARSGAGEAISASRRTVAELRASILGMSGTPLEQSIAAARRAAEQEADTKRYVGDDRKTFVDTKVDEARAAYAQSQASYILDALRGQQDSVALSERELQLAGASDSTRDTELEKLRLALEIRRQFPDMAAADVAQIMSGVDAQQAVNEKLKVTAATLGEVRGYGNEFVDEVLSEDTWSSWGNAGKTMLNSLKSEFIKLALLNPLKNLINGNSNLPTLTSALGNIAGLFGGKGATVSASTIGPPGNATGTESFSGGLTYVHENGGEIMDLPTGTRIYPAAESRRMMQASNDTGGGGMRVAIDLNTDLFTATVSSAADQRIGAAAPGIAAGGAQLGKMEMTKARRRQLGRRG
jgi:hypothetical protein